MTTKTKACSKRGRVLAATPDNFDRKKTVKYGLHPVCKSCRAAHNRSFYLANSERIKARVSQWQKEHQEQRRQYNQEWSARNKEHRAEYNRRYAREHPEQMKEHQRRKRQKNQEQARVYALNYLSRRRANEGRISLADVRERYQRQNGQCNWCSVDVGDKFHVDHVIPVSRGGSNLIGNIVITCPSCNMSKGNKLPYTEWIPPKPL
jgi:5-methylcytosine-specific restriction endonuclease McrA